MLCNKKPGFMPLRLLAVLSCLNSCTITSSKEACPVYPVAGPLVAAELEDLSGEDYPQTWEWLARINRLRQELELCARLD